MRKGSEAQGLLIYGGSFNPVHIGHLRLAIEAREILAALVANVDFVPTAAHPQKPQTDLLPFELRARMLEAVIRDLPGMRCNLLEAERSGPSYTVDTLREYRRNHRAEELYFLLGSQDYQLLSGWHDGLALSGLCNLAIAPRGNFLEEQFIKTTTSYWPDARLDTEATARMSQKGLCLSLANGLRIFYLSVPYLEISASRIRERWLNHLNIRFLMPQAALSLLEKNRALAQAVWREIDQ